MFVTIFNCGLLWRFLVFGTDISIVIQWNLNFEFGHDFVPKVVTELTLESGFDPDFSLDGHLDINSQLEFGVKSQSNIEMCR